MTDSLETYAGVEFIRIPSRITVKFSRLKIIIADLWPRALYNILQAASDNDITNKSFRGRFRHCSL